mmetsp:Transcript_20788/g.48800  ORF Transcript_20788/g.48800 Transcript_20788/m.48800 type:complete len:458 (-) Transcript_20788:190-1563(-)
MGSPPGRVGRHPEGPSVARSVAARGARRGGRGLPGPPPPGRRRDLRRRRGGTPVGGGGLPLPLHRAGGGVRAPGGRVVRLPRVGGVLGLRRRRPRRARPRERDGPVVRAGARVVRAVLEVHGPARPVLPLRGTSGTLRTAARRLLAAPVRSRPQRRRDAGEEVPRRDVGGRGQVPDGQGLRPLPVVPPRALRRSDQDARGRRTLEASLGLPREAPGGDRGHVRGAVVVGLQRVPLRVLLGGVRRRLRRLPRRGLRRRDVPVVALPPRPLSRRDRRRHPPRRSRDGAGPRPLRARQQPPPPGAEGREVVPQVRQGVRELRRLPPPQRVRPSHQRGGVLRHPLRHGPARDVRERSLGLQRSGGAQHGRARGRGVARRVAGRRRRRFVRLGRRHGAHVQHGDPRDLRGVPPGLRPGEQRRVQGVVHRRLEGARGGAGLPRLARGAPGGQALPEHTDESEL